MSESRLSEMHLVVDDSGENPFARGVDDMVCVAYDIFRKFSLYDGFDKLSFDDDAPDEMFSIVLMILGIVVTILIAYINHTKK